MLLGNSDHASPRCPQCRSPIRWEGNRHRPFCSLECRLIDLGVWLDERYRIEGGEAPNNSLSEDHATHSGG